MREWQIEKLYHTGDHFYESVFNDFRRAKHTIHLEIHYLDSGPLSEILFKESLIALERGLRINVIVDGFSPNSKKLKKLWKQFILAGGKMSFFNPMPWNKFCLKGILKINQRNHKKVILIDKKRAYIGSYNFDTRQMSVNYGGEEWRDIGCMVEGNAVKQVLSGFGDSWLYCQGKRKKSKLKKLSNVRLNHEKGLRKKHLDDLIERMNVSKKEIWISNPYFVPDFRMIDALSNASKRGLDVKILLPQKSDLRFFPLINSIFYKEVLNCGVEVYEYSPSILHAKIMIIDDWMIIGSSNLNSRTQKHDWEIDIEITKESTKTELKSRLTRDFRRSRQLSINHITERFQNMRFSVPLFKAIKFFL